MESLSLGAADDQKEAGPNRCGISRREFMPRDPRRAVSGDNKRAGFVAEDRVPPRPLRQPSWDGRRL